VDDKGRLKLPAAFRSVIEPRYGNEFYVTSMQGDCVEIYPMEVYAEFEQRIIKASKVNDLVRRLRSNYNYFGQSAVMDASGRILIHPLLRESAGIAGEVSVLGNQDYLEVWNRDSVKEQIRPFNSEERSELSSLGF
jgi:MraZ protein